MSNPGIGANCVAVAMMSSFLPLLAIDRYTTVNHVPLILGIPTRYVLPQFLHTSGTIELILDFSTGVMAGVKLCES
jgi:hypothetical protein